MTTTTPNWPALYASIQRCNAVYNPDAAAATAAFRALGSDVLGRYCDDTHQAIAHRTAGRATLTISGTRVTEGTIAEHFGDLACDAIFSPWDIGGGAKVAAGALDGMGKLWNWALPLFGEDRTINAEGHSLGGQRTCLTPLFIPGRVGALTAWEPPKAGNAEFWRQYADMDLTTIVHKRDPWAAWPWVSELMHKPGSLLWLNGKGWEWTTAWPGGDLFAWGDHGPDSVVAAVGKLAG